MIGTQLISEIFGAEIVTYFYDASGRPIGMRYMNTDDSFALEHYFYFELNIFGDIVAVYDEEYNKILSYSYDAWGNFTTTVHTTDTEKAYKAQCNSLTYRGYYYDEETNLYYLQTRYYSPELCRFISADSVDYLDPDSITGLNLFAYCGNDPVNFVDPSGHMAVWLSGIIISAVIGVVIGAVYGGFTAKANDQKVLDGALIGAGAGALMGVGTYVASWFLAPVIVGQAAIVGGVTYSAGTALAIGGGIAFGSGFVVGGAADAITQQVNNGCVNDWGSVFVSGVQWGVINTSSAFLGSLAGPVSNFYSGLLSGMFGSVTSAVGMTIDILRNRHNQIQQPCINNLLYVYNVQLRGEV